MELIRKTVRLGILTLLLAIARAQAFEFTSGITAWWPFDGDDGDFLGTENPVRLIGNPLFVDARVGQGVRLNGNSTYGRVPATPEIDIGAHSGLTVELWINPRDVFSPQPLLEWSDGTSAVGLHLWIAVESPWAGGGHGSIYANFINIDQVAHHVSSRPGVLKPNAFQHVAITYSQLDGIARLYVNGRVVANTNIGSHRIETCDDLFFARRPYPGNAGAEYAFDGIMDEVTLYSRELSSTEVLSVFTAGAAGKGGPTLRTVPRETTVNGGASARFNVQAQGVEPLRYQWFRNSVAIQHETNQVLHIRRARSRDAAVYWVQVSNDVGATDSTPVALNVRFGHVTILGVPKGNRRSLRDARLSLVK